MPIPVELNGEVVSIIRCGTVDNAPDWVQRTPENLQRWRERLQQRSPQEVLEIPVVFHVITNSSGSGSLSDAAIQEQIDTLNASYLQYDIQFTLQDILPYENSNWYADPWSYENAMKSELAVDPAHTLNIYTAGMTSGQSSGLLGWAYFPWSFDESNSMHGLVIHYQSLPGVASWAYDEGKTAVHEVGHYLGLYHTFQDGCVNGPNSGDYCEDTPAQDDGNNIYQCNESLDTCPSDPGNDPVHNYMNYTDDACMNNFTPDQGARIAWALENYKPSLGEIMLAGDNCEDPFQIVSLPADRQISAIQDFNNDYGQLNLIGNGWNGKDVVFAFEPAYDVDITLTMSAEYNNAIAVFTDCNDPAGSMIAGADEDASAPYSETINATLSSGETYYIVNGAKNLFAAGSTTLSVTGVFACTDDSYEDNDTVADAVSLTTGAYDLTLCPTDTNASGNVYDIFSRDVPANTVLTARAEWTNDSDADVYLMAPALAPDQYVDHSWYDNPEVVSYANPTDQPVEFLVAVNLYSGIQPTDYTLTLEETSLQQDIPRNLTATPTPGAINLRWDPPIGANTYLTQIEYHDSVATDAMMEETGRGYGVVFDLQSFPDAVFQAIDFNYTGRQTFHGPYYYHLHLYDWDADTLIARFDSLTVPDAFDGPAWESEVSLAGISVDGVSHAGIFIEPLSGDPTDAYPALSTDSSTPAESGKNYSVDASATPFTDATDLATTSYGDFLMNLQIETPAGDAIALTSLGTRTMLPSRDYVESMGQRIHPENRSPNVTTTYNLYRDNQLLAGDLQDSTYTDSTVQADVLYSYRVTAMFDGNFESDSSNIASAMVTGSNTGDHFAPLAPDNDYQPMQLNITKAMRRGIPLQAGDEIGVFRDSLCYAAATLTSEISAANPLPVAVPADDPSSGVIDGFLDGDTLRFRIWDSADSVEVSSMEKLVRTGSRKFSANGSATLELYGLNMAPVFTGIDSLTIIEDSSASFPLEAVDVDGDSLTFSVSSDTDAVSAGMSDNTAYVMPDPNWYGEAIISVHVSDGDLSNVGFVILTVEPVNDPPSPFALYLPQDSTRVLLDEGNLDNELVFDWQDSEDPDDVVRYSMYVESGNLSPIAFSDTATTTFTYTYQELLDFMTTAEESYIDGEWTIVASDGQDSVLATSNPRYLSVDATTVGIDERTQKLPEHFFIGQNYPNPFNPTTTVEYGLPKQADVNIRIYDILGHEIASLVNTRQEAGYYTIAWDGKNNAGAQVASGVYMYMITARSADGTSQYSRTRKLLLIR